MPHNANLYALLTAGINAANRRKWHCWQAPKKGIRFRQHAEEWLPVFNPLLGDCFIRVKIGKGQFNLVPSPSPEAAQ